MSSDPITPPRDDEAIVEQLNDSHYDVKCLGIRSLRAKYREPIEQALRGRFPELEAWEIDDAVDGVFDRLLRFVCKRPVKIIQGSLSPFLITIAWGQGMAAWRTHKRRANLLLRHRSFSPEWQQDNVSETQWEQDNASGTESPFDALINAERRRWWRSTIAKTLRRMKAECFAKKRSTHWEIFKRCLIIPILNDADPPRLETVAKELNLQSPAQASNLLTSARRMFTRILPTVIREIRPANASEEVDQYATLKVGLSSGRLFRRS